MRGGGRAGGLTRRWRNARLPADRDGATIIRGVLPEITEYKNALRQGWAQGTRSAIKRHAEEVYCPGTEKGGKGKKFKDGKRLDSIDEETSRKSVEKTENVAKRYNLCLESLKNPMPKLLREAYDVKDYNGALEPLVESPRLAKLASDLMGGEPVRLQSASVYRRGSPERYKTHIQVLNSPLNPGRGDDSMPLTSPKASVHFWCPISKKPDIFEDSAPIPFKGSHEYHSYASPIVDQYFDYLEEATKRYKNSTAETGDPESHKLHHGGRYIFSKKAKFSKGKLTTEGQLNEQQKKLKLRQCKNFGKKTDPEAQEYDVFTRYVPNRDRQYSVEKVLCMPALVDDVKYKYGPQIANLVVPAHASDTLVSDYMWASAMVPDYDVGDCMAFSGSTLVATPAQAANSTATPSEFATFVYQADSATLVPGQLWYGRGALEKEYYGGNADQEGRYDHYVSYDKWYKFDGEQSRLSPDRAPLLWPQSP